MHSYKSLSAWQHENHPPNQASMNPLSLIVHVSLLQSHILTMTPGMPLIGLQPQTFLIMFNMAKVTFVLKTTYNIDDNNNALL